MKLMRPTLAITNMAMMPIDALMSMTGSLMPMILTCRRNAQSQELQ
jgi:hypothetical protein